jgi:hypothetical protein
MSELTDFAKAAFSSARSVIGGESVAIGGGTAVSCVLNAASDGRSYEAGGYDAETELTAVADKTEFEAAYTGALRSYLGKTATARGRTFRVTNIRSGQGFYEIQLGSTERGG